MRRRLFTLAALLSLPLFMVTVVLWVRSYWTCDTFTDWVHVRHDQTVFVRYWPIVESESGGMVFRLGASYIYPAEPFPSDRWQVSRARRYPDLSGFASKSQGELHVLRSFRRHAWGFDVAK
ncbi:MAG TPA: hypothetical protein VIM11_13250 [Tepidisphaeraceae bacterium]|jgi:hypothetical protein